MDYRQDTACPSICVGVDFLVGFLAGIGLLLTRRGGKTWDYNVSFGG